MGARQLFSIVEAERQRQEEAARAAALRGVERVLRGVGSETLRPEAWAAALGAQALWAIGLIAAAAEVVALALDGRLARGRR